MKMLIRLLPVVVLGLLLPALAQAKLAVVGGTPTNIQGDVEKLIAFRHQERFWFTADGHAHLLVNLGTGNGNAGLTLLSRPAAATDWSVSFPLPGTDNTSTGDTLVTGNVLQAVYSDSAGEVRYASSVYDSASHRWAAPLWSVVYDGSDGPARGPTLTIGAQGGVYAAFTVKNAETGVYRIRLSSSPAPLATWADTTRRWGTPNLAKAKTGRLVNLGNRIGLIYTDQTVNSAGIVEHSIHWAEPVVPGELGGAWSDQELYRGPSDRLDPFGSHFNVAGDALGNLYLAWAVEEKVRYLRYQGSTRQWNYSRWLLPFQHTAAFVQMVTHIDGRVFALFNFGSYILVMESVDGGYAFKVDALLLHSNNPELDWSRPRIEVPTAIWGPLTILQQVEVGFDTTYETLYDFRYTP